jgi:hypothetical protein
LGKKEPLTGGDLNCGPLDIAETLEEIAETFFPIAKNNG